MVNCDIRRQVKAFFSKMLGMQQLTTFACLVSVIIVCSAVDPVESLNSRNYEEYRTNKNFKRESDRSRHGGVSRVPVSTYIQKDWDFADVLQYFRNERLVILQIRCFFSDGPCDLVGRWAKDRVIPGFFGICVMCTETQQGWFDLWLSYLLEKFPDLLRAAMIRYFLSLGIKVPDEEVRLMYTIFKKRRYGNFTIQRINL